MNCDQAFDCLTDSRRRHSAELERHLANCPRCRQMHDTLEPALDLFDCVVEEPDVSALVREPRATGQPESLRVAESQTHQVLDRIRRRQDALELSGQAERHDRQCFVEALLERSSGIRVFLRERSREIE